jgi:NAD-dependent deacetylase
MQKIVVLTGAGMSAESGISTFRGADGLWEGHDIMEVASPKGWHNNMELVLEFYNLRRKQLKEVKPNLAHFKLTELEEKYDLQIITQNVDDLHERAGAQNVLHLHGELRKIRSTRNPLDIKYWEGDLVLGQLCPLGAQYRPHIVWFGEAVPKIEEAISIISNADIVIIIGTSMQVYPAAGLISYAPLSCKSYYIDPFPAINHELKNRDIEIIENTAVEAVPELVKKLLIPFLP